MKYKILNQTDTHIELFVLYEDNTYSSISLIGGRPIEEVLKDAYILSKNTDRLPYEGTVEDFETYVKPQSVATKLTNVNYNNFTADVIDQFGEKMNVDATFEIEGTGARIENGKIIEDVVDSHTSYFIVARYGDLEERQERVIYAPREVEPSEMDKLSKRQEMTESALAELMMMIPTLTGGGDL